MSSLLKSTQNTRTVLPNSFRYVRSDVPYSLTEQEIDFLLKNNLTTVVDLRTIEETEQCPCVLQGIPQFQYINMPVTGGNLIPKTPQNVVSSYLDMVDKQMWKIIETIESSVSNVLYFCNAGKDRTGVVSALLLNNLGYSDQYIINDYMLSAINLETMLVNYATNNNVDLKIITPHETYMKEFLEKF